MAASKIADIIFSTNSCNAHDRISHRDGAVNINIHSKHRLLAIRHLV
jgi:hypothetical protein